MKKLILIFVFAFGIFTIQAQEIQWLTLNEALAAQKKAPKPIFMDVYTDWCGPCKMLSKNTFTNAEFATFISKNYYAVKFNGEGNSEVTFKGTTYKNPKFDPDRKGRNAVHDFTMFLKVQGYPSMYVIDAKGNIAKTIVGYYQAEQLLTELKN